MAASTKPISIPKGAIMSFIRFHANSIQSYFNSKRCDYEFNRVVKMGGHRNFNSKRCDYEAEITRFCNSSITYFNSKRCDYETGLTDKNGVEIYDFNSKRCDYEIL